MRTTATALLNDIFLENIRNLFRACFKISDLLSNSVVFLGLSLDAYRYIVSRTFQCSWYLIHLHSLITVVSHEYSIHKPSTLVWWELWSDLDLIIRIWRWCRQKYYFFGSQQNFYKRSECGYILIRLGGDTHAPFPEFIVFKQVKIALLLIVVFDIKVRYESNHRI